MPTLPNDAVIQGIYGVMISNRTSTPVAIMALTCNAFIFSSWRSDNEMVR
jgi:hypothetical protein